MRRAKFSVAVHERDLESVAVGLSRLQGLDLLEPEQREGAERWREIRGRLERQRERLEELLLELEGRSREQSVDRFRPSEDVMMTEERLSAAEEAVRAWRSERDDLAAEEERVRELELEALRLSELGVTRELLEGLERLDLTFGWIPRRELRRFHLPLLQRPIAVFIAEPKEEEDAVFVAAAAERGRGFVLDRLLGAAFFEPLRFLRASEEPPRAPQDLEERAGEIEVRREELEEQKRVLARQWAEPLASALGRVRGDLRAIELLSRSAAGGVYYFMSGYVADEKTADLVDLVDGAAANPHAICVGHA